MAARFRRVNTTRRWTSNKSGATTGKGAEREYTSPSLKAASTPPKYYNPYRQPAATTQPTEKITQKYGAAKSDLLKINAPAQEYNPLESFKTWVQRKNWSEEGAMEMANRNVAYNPIYTGSSVTYPDVPPLVPPGRRIGGEQYNPSVLPPTLRTGEKWMIDGKWYRATQLSDYQQIRPRIGLRGTKGNVTTLPEGAVVSGNVVYLPLQPVNTRAAQREGTSSFLKTGVLKPKTTTTEPSGNLYRGLHSRVIPGGHWTKPGSEGVLPPPPSGGGGGGGGGGYEPWYPTPPIGSSYGYGSPFNQYQRGYAAQGSQPMEAPGVGTRGEAQRYRNVNPNVYAARYQQLLTNWRI